MKSKVGKTLLKIPLTLLLSPYYLIKAVRNVVMHLFKSLKFSIRRKITANYLTLYLVASAITFVLMVSGFMKAEISEKSYEIYTYVDNIVGKYEQGIFDSTQMEQRISSIAEIENCGILLTFNKGDQIFKSDRYNAFLYPSNFWQKIGTLVSYKMFSDELVIYYFDPDGGEQLTAQLALIHPIAPFYKRVTYSSTMLLISIVIGFFILWIFGGMNNRRILKPIYDITKTAEKISITNMRERLDVGKAKYELRDLAITLNDMLSRLQEEYEKQKRFVSDVSHELRTPISIVNGYASMLSRWGKEDPAILEESIEAIIDEAQNMQVLVENLLTLVRADNQTLQFNKEDFYMNEIMTEVTTESLMINGKNQSIVSECVEPILVNLDFKMIKQVLRIFVDNAVKYTPAGGHIHIRCVYEDVQCAVYIKDNGIGILKEDLPYIFDRFYRSDESRTRETGGHGLGLSIAKAIVLGHGGRIKVKSKKNEGSEFAIFLPTKTA